LRGHRPRQLTFRYVSALLSIAGLLAAGQLLVQCALDRQEGDARVINMAGRQRMLSQRLCMLMMAGGDLRELLRVTDEWQASQAALSSARDNSDDIDALFEQIAGDHRAMLGAARRMLAGDRDADAKPAVAHQDAFLSGMDHIVAAYEREARDRVIRLRRIELALLALALVVLALVGMFVFRPAVRALRQHLAERDQAERQLLEVADREQKRIAQVLHDGVGQHLIGVSSLVKALGKDANQDARLDEIGRLLAEAVDQTRSLARGLHSHTLEMAGLVEALRELAMRTEKIFGITCRVDAGEVAEPPLDVLVHLHNIAREAVANAAKHAHASMIEVSLVEIAGELRLTVRDDGVGIAPQAGTGMGLQMMRHRAKMIGASLRVAAGEAKGTVVSCTLPLGDHV
jgi:signal transduction histidine kinase